MTAISFAFPLANGLHARPASLLQEICLRFAADVIFRNRRSRRRADGKSVLELVASATIAGDPCALEVSGPQEQEAARALRAFLQHDLPHADDAPPAAAVAADGPEWLPPVFHDKASPLLRGRPLAPGTGQGVALRLERPRQMPRRFAAGKKDPRLERRLFRAALEKARDGLRRQAEQDAAGVGAGILKAQLAILGDPRFWQRCERLIAREKMPAGAAVKKTAAAVAAVLRSAPSAYLRERAGDLDDIAALLGEHLYGQGKPAAAPPARRPYVGVAAALSPAGLLALDRRQLRGLALGEVGFTAHVAILARSLGIPAVALPPAALSSLGAGAEVIVDGRRGLVAAAPGAALKRYYRLEREAAGRKRQPRAGLARRPATTRDGRRVELAANIGSAAEIESAWQNGAEAIGLFRSEMLFLDREAPPGEEEQYAVYSQAARTARGRPVIIRLLDAGGDKNIPYLGLPGEANPMLGYRAVRFYGEHKELLRCQLRAILRAAAHGRRGRLQVMVPMVTSAREVRLVRELLAEAASELRGRQVRHARRLELGIMVETPAAALAVDALAGEADFFSVGSNDLLQYTLAVDRGNARLAGLFDPLHPSFLRLLRQAAVQARHARRWLGLCGEMAGNREYLPLLVGIGFDELSMAPGSIPAVRERLAQLDQGECRALLRSALRCTEASDVAARLREFNGQGGTLEASGAEIVRLGSASRTAGEAIKELCDLLELAGRVSDASALEQAVWKREQAFATDLGLGFALPHGKSAAVRAASVAFLRPARPMRWSGRGGPPVRAVLLIAVPEQGGEEHLRLIARLSRRLMHEDFRAALLAAANEEAVLAALRGCLAAN